MILLPLKELGSVGMFLYSFNFFVVRFNNLIPSEVLIHNLLNSVSYRTFFFKRIRLNVEL